MRCSFPPSSFERSSFPHLLVVASVAVGLLVGCSGEASSPLPAARAAIDAAASERVAHAPRLVRQPESISAPEGSPALFVAEADGDPDMADIAIPGNDDSMRSIDVVIRELCLAIAEGKQQRQAKLEGDQGAPGADGQRRSRRAQYRADDAPAMPEEAAAAPAGKQG